MNQNPQPTLIPTFGGPNYAPIDPILKARDPNSKISNYLCDALKEKYAHFNKTEDRAWNQIFSIGKMVALFESGDQIPVLNPYTGGIMAVAPVREDQSTKRALNQMQFYATKCRQMWIASDPSVSVSAGRQTDKAVQAARGGGALVDFYESKFYDEWFETTQGDMARTFGTYLIRLRWDMGVKGLIAVREVVENKTLNFDGAGYCGDCETVGIASKFQSQVPEHDDQFPGNPSIAHLPTCPNCGSFSVSIIDGTSKTVSSVVGTQNQNLGDMVCEQLPITGCRWDLYKRPEESSWFIYKQRVSAGQIRSLVGQIKVPGDDVGGDSGLEAQRMLAHAGQALGGKSDVQWSNRSATHTPQSVVLEEMWLSASDVEDIVLRGNEKTVSGQMIPEGRLSELCPDGLVCVGLNGMSTILGIYQESHKDHIVSGVYHPKVMSGAGRGAVDSVEVQRRTNTLDSQQLIALNAGATPGIIFRPEAFRSAENLQYLGLPQTMTPLNDLPQGMSLDDVAKQLPPTQISAAIVQYTQQFLNNQAQLASLCVEFSGAIPGVDNKTAHGAELAASLAQSLFAPMLLIKGYTRRRSAEIMVSLWRKHQPNHQYFPLAGRRNGSDGLILKAADLDVDLLFEVEEGSQTPKTAMSRRMAVQSAAQAFGSLAALIQVKAQFPKLVKPYEALFDIEVDDEDDAVDIMTLCRKRVTQMQQAEKMGAQSPQDLIGAIKPEISELEPQQDECATWFRQLLIDDDGQSASPLMRQAFEGLVALHASNHAQAEAQIAQLAGQVSQAAQQPTQDAQNQAQQAQQQQQAQLQMAQNQHQASLEQPNEGQEQPGEAQSDPNEAAEQSAQSAQDNQQQIAQQEQGHELKLEQMQAQQQHDAAMQRAEQGHTMLKLAAEHSHKEKLAELAAKAAKHKPQAKAKK